MVFSSLRYFWLVVLLFVHAYWISIRWCIGYVARLGLFGLMVVTGCMLLIVLFIFILFLVSYICMVL